MIREMLTEKAPSRKLDFKVEISGLSNAVNESISRANRCVVERGLTTGVEHLIMVDTRTGEWCYEEKGDESSVAWSGFFEFLKEAKEGQKFAFVHNHPTSRTFSLGDLSTFLKEDSIELMFAVGHNGDAFYVQGKKKKVAKSMLTMDLVDKDNPLLKALQKRLERQEIDVLDFQYEEMRIKLRYVLENYIEVYKEVPTQGRAAPSQGLNNFRAEMCV